MIPVTSLYLAVNTILFVGLSIAVVRLRWKYRVSLGDGGHDALQKAIRAFGNNAEYLPVAILLLAAMELSHGQVVVLHVFGISYTLGRVAHALAIHGKVKGIFRIFGMVLTYTAITLGAVYLLCLVC